MEQLDYNFLFRWFVSLNIDDPVWDVTVLTKNRDRLLAGDVAEAFFSAVLGQAGRRGLLSDEHFHRRRHLNRGLSRAEELHTQRCRRQTPPDDPGNPSVDFHGERPSNATHLSIVI
jgi:hypothetical protein